MVTLRHNIIRYCRAKCLLQNTNREEAEDDPVTKFPPSTSSRAGNKFQLPTNFRLPSSRSHQQDYGPVVGIKYRYEKMRSRSPVGNIEYF